MDSATRFSELLEAYAEDRASAADLQELEALLKSSAEFRKALVERTMDDVYLRKTLQVLPARENVGRARRLRLYWAAGAVVAAVLAIAALLHFRQIEEPIITHQPPPAAEVQPKVASLPRDPANWPFSSSSPWNTPIGSQAQFAEITGPLADAGFPLTINAKEFGLHVYEEQPDAPPTKITVGTGPEQKPLGEFRIPQDAVSDSIGYGCLLFVDSCHENVYELLMAKRVAGGVHAAAYLKEDLRGSGLDFPANMNGSRQFGGTSLGGLLRKNDLSGIRHALALSVPRTMLESTPVWPALKGGSAVRGKLHVGSLVALPPDVDLSKLKLGGKALEIARAFQDYGAYVVSHLGTKDQRVAICVEIQAGDSMDADIQSQFQRFSHFIKIVTSNSPQSPGGGGTPRRELAPELPGYKPAEF